jgi:fermentation-respiration switch protein FrsA (DUF1100 family)
LTLAEYRTGVKIASVDSAGDLATMSPRPVLIIHGLADTLFRPSHAQKIYDLAQEPKELWWVEGVGHINPIEGHEAEYQERLLKFFEQAFRPL